MGLFFFWDNKCETFVWALDNYLIWSQFMLIALKVKNKVGFAYGTCKKPKSEENEAFAYGYWMQ